MKFQREIPIPEGATVVERWWLNVRGKTFRQVPLETGLSLPVPIFQETAGRCMSVFYYGIRRGGGPGRTVVKPPVARILATFPEGRLLSFAHMSVEALFPGLPKEGELGALILGGAAPAERVALRKELFGLYSEILPLYYDKQNLMQTKRDRFLNTWQAVAEPPLEAYYKALNMDFFDWLEAGG